MSKPNTNDVFEFRFSLRLAMDNLSQMFEQLDRINDSIALSKHSELPPAVTFQDERDRQFSSYSDCQLQVDIRHHTMAIVDSIEALNIILFEADKQEKTRMAK